jgi:hypothetical protein
VIGIVRQKMRDAQSTPCSAPFNDQLIRARS